MTRPTPVEILDRRLATEADRQQLTIEELRFRLLEEGLERAEEHRAAAREAERSRALEEALRAQIIVVTATETERDELARLLDERGLSLSTVKGQLSYKRIVGIPNHSILWMEVAIGPFRSDGAAMRCRTARAETGASTVILLGTAFGLDHVKMGDVIVSDAVCMYDDRKVTQDRGNLVVLCRGPTKIASGFWVNRFREFATTSRTLSEPFGLHVGTVLSGGAVVESALYRDALADRAATELGSAVVGGEMEAAGLLAGADDVDWVVVKGISDTADGRTRQDDPDLRARQGLAARNAASALLGTLLLPEPKGQEIHA